MPIRFRCPQCKTPLNTPDDYAGGSAKCKKCGAKIRIPTPAHDDHRQSMHDAPASAAPGSLSSDARSASTAVVPEDEATPPATNARSSQRRRLPVLGIVLAVAGVAVAVEVLIGVRVLIKQHGPEANSDEPATVAVAETAAKAPGREAPSGLVHDSAGSEPQRTESGSSSKRVPSAGHSAVANAASPSQLSRLKTVAPQTPRDLREAMQNAGFSSDLPIPLFKQELITRENAFVAGKYESARAATPLVQFIRHGWRSSTKADVRDEPHRQEVRGENLRQVRWRITGLDVTLPPKNPDVDAGSVWFRGVDVTPHRSGEQGGRRRLALLVVVPMRLYTRGKPVTHNRHTAILRNCSLWPWYLTKSGTIRRCKNPAEVAFVLRENAIVYYADVDCTSIIVWDIDASSAEDLTASITITDLHETRHLIVGAYRADVLKLYDQDTERVRRSSALESKNEGTMPAFFPVIGPPDGLYRVTRAKLLEFEVRSGTEVLVSVRWE